VLKTQGKHFNHHISVVYDSDYAFKAITGVNAQTERDGALVQRCKGVFQELYLLFGRRGRNVHFVHIEGHSDNRLNDYADRLAALGKSLPLKASGVFDSNIASKIKKSIAKSNPEEYISHCSIRPGDTRYISLNLLLWIGRKAEGANFSPKRLGGCHHPNDVCMKVTITGVYARVLEFRLDGFDEYRFQILHSQMNTMGRVNPFKKLHFVPGDHYNAEPELNTSLRALLDTCAAKITPGVGSKLIDAARMPITRRVTRSQTTSTSSLDDAGNVETAVSSSDGTVRILVPVMSKLEPHWEAIRTFDLSLLGRKSLRTVLKVPYYLTRKISSILDATLTMANNLSREHKPKTFNPVQWDLVLKLKLLLPAMLLQMQVGRSGYKRRIDAFLQLRWQDIIDDMTLSMVKKHVRSTRGSVSATSTPLGSLSPLTTSSSDMSSSPVPSLRDGTAGIVPAEWSSYCGVAADDDTFRGIDFNELDDISKDQDRKASIHITNGELRKAKTSLTDPISFAPATVDTYCKLVTKHPKRAMCNEIQYDYDLEDDPRPPDISDSDSFITVDEEMVWGAIKDAPRGAAPGIDGLRFDHLYYMGESGTQTWLKSLTHFSNLALQGKLPQWYYTFVASASLIALEKSNKDVRPIAMGSVWRKLYSKAALTFLHGQITAHFNVYQYGVGTRSGCEVVIKRVLHVLERHPSYALLKTDFSNAFNSIYRKKMLTEVELHFPGLLKFTTAVYGPKSELWTWIDDDNREAILSEEGVQQGDVLGPFLFCLTIHPLLKLMNTSLRNRCDSSPDAGDAEEEVLGLMDDLTFVCAPAALPTVWPLLEQGAKDVGLSLSLPKCEVWSPAGPLSPSDDKCIHSDIKRVPAGMVVLGAPVGTDEFCSKFWREYLKDIERETKIVCRWNKVQGALSLFRICICSRLNYMLRNCPPEVSYVPQLIAYARSIMRGGLCLLLGKPYYDFVWNSDADMHQPTVAEEDETWWIQATLPPKFGGMGIIDPSSIHPVAFLASEAAVACSISELNNVHGLPEFQPSSVARQCYDKYVDKARYPSLALLFQGPLKLQHSLATDIHNARRALLKARSKQIAIRLDSCSEEGSILITALPKYKEDSIEGKDLFRERLEMRLGLPIGYIQTGNCKCNTPSGSFVDSTNFHLLSQCTSGNDPTITHNAVADVLVQMARRANLTARKEDRAILLANDPDCKHRMDVVIDNFSNGSSLSLDVSIIDPRGAVYSSTCSELLPGKAANDKEQVKIRKYGAIYAGQGCLFEPFVLESFGRFGHRTRKIFQELLQRVFAAHDYLPLAYHKLFWKTRILMALHRNAAIGVKKRMDNVLRRRKGLDDSTSSSSNVYLPCEKVDLGCYSRCRG